MIGQGRRLWTVAATLGFTLMLAACGGDDGGGGTPPPVQDKTAPVTAANPGGGTYGSTRVVTLTASEPSTIYYTTRSLSDITEMTIFEGCLNPSSCDDR